MNLFSDSQHVAGLKRVGALAATFFFIKGLLWIAAPFVFLWLS